MLEVWEEEELLKVAEAIYKIVGKSQGQRIAYEQQELNAIMWPQSFKAPADAVLAGQALEPNIDKPIQEVKQEQTTAFLKFTEQEILKMPKQVRKEFRVDGCTARITKRKSGKNSFCYEIRYRRNGYNVAVSSTSLQAAKDKFITALSEADKTQSIANKVPTRFHDFAMYYFENYHIRKVAESTYKNQLGVYKRHIQNTLGLTQTKDIGPIDCKAILDKLENEGRSRTREEVHLILNQIFDMAIAHDILKKNPLAVLIYDKHERETGTPISKTEEKALLTALNGTKYLLPITILLYTGVRPNELYTTYIEGSFIVANNSKRKRNQKKETKKIAISPMLKPYLPASFDSKEFPSAVVLIDQLQKTLPKHTLKDCRMTFSTRAQECGVDRTVIKLFMGHSLSDMLGRHYTEFSDEYLIKEAQKIKY